MAYSGFSGDKNKTAAGSAKDASFEHLSKLVSRRDLDLPLCVTCSTQTDRPNLNLASEDDDIKCEICLDPRQFIGVHGQQWTSLTSLIKSKTYHNEFETLEEGRIWAFKTVPSFGIGQRAFLIKDDSVDGFVMWDCIAYLDDATLQHIDKLSDGKGIRHLILSHPHYLSTTAVWVQAFSRMQYWEAEVDFREWYQRRDVHKARTESSGQDSESTAAKIAMRYRLFDDRGPHRATPLQKGSPFTILQLGGHFPGSACLLWRRTLFIADTIQVVPSGLYRSDQPQREGVASMTFLWSYPNQIPLSAKEIKQVCEPLEHFAFDRAYGAFEGFNILGFAKDKILQSRDIHVKRLEG